MSKINTSHSLGKEDGTSVSQPEEILSLRQPSGDSALADESGQNDIRLGAYEIYVQREQQPNCEMDDWLHAEREWNKALVLQAFDTLFNKRMLPLSAYGRQITFNTAHTLLPVVKACSI